jgi:hypothetical protein
MTAEPAPQRIFLWSGPRNISTALMYSFAQRSDCRVVDEPLYGHYLKRSPAKDRHPSADAIMAQMECGGKRAVQNMLQLSDRKVIFFKNMTHHLYGLDLNFLRSGKNILLTRAPREMLPSFHKVIPCPTMKDVGYEDQIQLAEHLKNEGIPFRVIEGKSILNAPEEQLKILCTFLEIPFEHAMLQWKAGGMPEDGPWARHWYHSVHASTGFKPYKAAKEPLPVELESLYQRCASLYERLIKDQ